MTTILAICTVFAVIGTVMVMTGESELAGWGIGLLVIFGVIGHFAWREIDNQWFEKQAAVSCTVGKEVDCRKAIQNIKPDSFAYKYSLLKYKEKTGKDLTLKID